MPEGFTNYDKVVIEYQGAPMTVQGLFDWLRDNKGVRIDFLNSADQVALFEATSSAQTQQRCLNMTPEAIYLEKTDNKPLPAGRNYLTLEVQGTIIESGDYFEMPPIKYYFA